MMEIFNHEQGTPEWLQCRIGIPTASEFSTVLAKGKDGGPSLTRAAYMRRIAAEIITGEPLEILQERGDGTRQSYGRRPRQLLFHAARRGTATGRVHPKRRPKAVPRIR